MPHRFLNMNETAAYLHLERRDLEALVKRSEIPFERQGDRILFQKRQIDAWASQRILGMSGKRLAEYHRTSSLKHHNLSPKHALMPELLTPARINPGMPSKTKPSVVRDMVAMAEKTELLYNPADLITALKEREEMCSTAIDGGMALLHPRHHEPYMFMDSFVVLGRTTQPIPAGAPDGKPTDIFFLVCCQDDRTHLHTLARLCSMALSTAMLANLRSAHGAKAMHEVIMRSEEEAISLM
jgi:nitrogen PTS system EIIA component